MAVVQLNNIGGGANNSALKRRSYSDSLDIHQTVGSADVLDIRNVSAVAIKIPAAVTAINVFGCHTDDGTFTQIHDWEGTAAAITSVTAGDWYDLPACIFAFPYIRIKSTTANGTATVVAKS
jgi:hypothetical protein